MARPQFDVSVPANGYRWWYVDAMSDDGQHGFTIIGFVGSVFSPYYFRARKRGDTAAENHCAINVALYGKAKRWAMTERGSRHVSRDVDVFAVGPSSMRWSGQELVIEINERCMPLPRSLRGRVRLQAKHFYDEPVALDENGKHFWQAVAPDARVRVEFESPKLSWAGRAYHDMNWGVEPLEACFRNWTWLRANSSTGTHVVYNLAHRGGGRFTFARTFDNGAVSSSEAPKSFALRRGFWGMERRVLSEAQPQLLGAFEDAPFYTRNHVAVTLDGKPCEAFHESLSLSRFSHPIVQIMLPFRMPRVS